MEHEFPLAMRERLSRIRTVAVEFDYDEDEPIMKATRREGITTRDDWRELCWVIGSRYWPADWYWELHVEPAFA
jgi:hypothetical protein